MVAIDICYYPIRLMALQELRSRCRRRGALLLTYDDGPGVRLTTTLLELLDDYDARATFFLLGKRIVEGQSCVEKAHAAGHELGVHTFNHGHAWKLPTKDAIEDIDRGYVAASNWVPAQGPFRPPHGKLTFATWKALRKRGTRICWWTVDSGDTWQTLPAVEHASKRVHRSGGGVVLMHDFDRGQARETFVLETTECLLRTARAEGLRIMTFSQLFAEST